MMPLTQAQPALHPRKAHAARIRCACTAPTRPPEAWPALDDKAEPCRCALCLLKEDAGELLRRLSIICLEDAVLHPGLPLIVWLMAAHSKVRLLPRAWAAGWEPQPVWLCGQAWSGLWLPTASGAH